jgi:hypothetical protein
MILEHRARNVAEILDAVGACSAQWAPDPADPEELWFRGEGERYALLPGLYRSKVRELNYDEENLQERFSARGTPFVPGGGGSEWDWYFRAQHYGIPTRLLDWTDSLLVATYFAAAAHVNIHDRRSFDSARRQRGKARPVFDPKSPVIWVLDAGSLNQVSYGKDFDHVFALGGPGTELYLSESLKERRERNRLPIAILPPHTNDRIIAQQGSFTIHGHEIVSIDSLANRQNSPLKLARIVLDRANIAHLWRELEHMGMTLASLMPGLESLAAVTKWFGQSGAIAPSKNRRNVMTKKKGGPRKRVKKPGRRSVR